MISNIFRSNTDTSFSQRFVDDIYCMCLATVMILIESFQTRWLLFIDVNTVNIIIVLPFFLSVCMLNSHIAIHADFSANMFPYSFRSLFISFLFHIVVVDTNTIPSIIISRIRMMTQNVQFDALNVVALAEREIEREKEWEGKLKEIEAASS